MGSYQPYACASYRVEEDLDARCLWPPRDLGQGLAWEEIAGWREATLREEGNRLWQEERAQLLRDGLDYETARPRLLDAYLSWVDTPQARLEGKTPWETILEEREERKGGKKGGKKGGRKGGRESGK